MAVAAEALKAQIKELSVEERAELASYLIDSLDAAADPEAETAWDAELARRAESIRDCTEIGEPAESVFSRLRARFS